MSVLVAVCGFINLKPGFVQKNIEMLILQNALLFVAQVCCSSVLLLNASSVCQVKTHLIQKSKHYLTQLQNTLLQANSFGASGELSR
jgi:hypothetical protein